MLYLNKMYFPERHKSKLAEKIRRIEGDGQCLMN